ncbi:hypothetical protein ACJMK2_037625 [Sinanodonta woodiana]|uniref:Uncharacterized protein n=1 Tax=Sinanodonta woodiana TaxID=1069815 RepID=A0ABD3WPJ2_SINWO
MQTTVVIAMVSLLIVTSSAHPFVKANRTCRIQCRKACRYGFRDTCPRCTCIENPCRHTKCRAIERCQVVQTVCYYDPYCPMKAECRPVMQKDKCNVQCRVACFFGFLDTCPRCTCSPDPCQDRQCEEDEECRAVNTECYYAPFCPKLNL